MLSNIREQLVYLRETYEQFNECKLNAFQRKPQALRFPLRQ